MAATTGAELKALRRLSRNADAWDEPDVREKFFGAGCILPAAVEQAISNIASLIKSVDSIARREEFLRFFETDAVAYSQAPHLLRGYARALVTAHARNWELAQKAAELFDEAWKLDSIGGNAAEWRFALSAFNVGPTSDARVERFAGLFKAVSQQTLGFWIVWDLLTQVGMRGDAVASECLMSVSTPILLVPLRVPQGDRPAATIRTMAIDLVDTYGSSFCPDLLEMGVVAFPQCDDEFSFLESMTRSWVTCAPKANIRGRWRLEYFETTEPDPRPFYIGRSAEAAACCAIVSAFKRHAAKSAALGPDDKLKTGMSPEEECEILDPWGAVSAKVSMPARPLAADEWRRLDLEEVDANAMQAKVNRAREAKLAFVVVAKGQRVGKHSVAHFMSLPEHNAGFEIIEAETLGEAYDLLTQEMRMVRQYQRNFVAKFDAKWPVDRRITIATK